MAIMGPGGFHSYFPIYLDSSIQEQWKIKEDNNPLIYDPRDEITDCVDVEVVTEPSPLEKQVGGDHYKGLAIQPSEYITKNGLGWYEGNAIKYITRHRMKGEKKDIEKAIHYLELLLNEYS